jgi:hypothetical protein
VKTVARLTSLASVALLASSLAACVAPRAPRASAPYEVRLLGAADGALRGTIRRGQSVFTGSAGRDYAIELTNDTASEVGVSIVLDGLDAMTGEPTTSCERLGMWMLVADGRARVRGFSVSDTRIATYRFAPPAQALAAIAKGGDPKAIGTIAVCFFSLKPRAPEERLPGVETPAIAFEGMLASEGPGQEPGAVAGELRDTPAAPHGPEVVADRLLSRIVIAYEDEDGAPLGTAPPPAGIARVARPRAEERPQDLAPMDEPPSSPRRDETKPHQPPKGAPKPPKPAPNPPKGPKYPIKG